MNTVSKDITVNVPLEQVFQFWQQPANYSRFMESVQDVEATGPQELHWKAAAPDGKIIEWDSKTVAENINEEIVWEWSGSTITSRFRVSFAAVGAEQTQVTVEMDYEPPQSSGAAIVKSFVDPAAQVEKDLQSFKRVIEGG